MLHGDIRASVRIRLRIGLDINLDVTEHYEDTIKAAVGVRSGSILCKKVPKGTTTWKAQTKKEASHFLMNISVCAIIKERINDIQTKLRQLSEGTSTLSVVDDVHHIEPVVLTIRNGGRSTHELSRSGYCRKYHVYD